MLGSSPQSSKQLKINESILRRKARNLRAKVKGFLPADICPKHRKRNRNVQEIQENRQFWKTTNSRYRWTLKKEKQPFYYYEHEKRLKRSQMFQKLNENQIEQINQDKIYYLGEEFINYFNQYLNQKLTKNNSFMPKRSKGEHLRKMKHLRNISVLKERNENKAKDSYKQFSERRKIKLEEDKTKGIIDRNHLREKLQKAQLNCQKIKTQKQEERRMKDIWRNYVHSQKQKNQLEKRQIRSLQERLRRQFIQRYTKTADQLNYSR